MNPLDSPLVAEVIAAHPDRFTPAANRRINRIIIHSTETGPYTARVIARGWTTKPAPGQAASAHYIIEPAKPRNLNPDNARNLFDRGGGTIIQCVREADVAFAAPGQNSCGIQLEHVGRTIKWDGRDAKGKQVAKPQPRTEWGKPGAPWHAQNLLETSAELAGELCHRYHIEVVELDAEAILASDEESGFVTHRTVSEACRMAKERNIRRAPWYRADKAAKGLNPWVKTDHGDPGRHWPMAWYLKLVCEARDRLVQQEVYGED